MKRIPINQPGFNGKNRFFTLLLSPRDPGSPNVRGWWRGVLHHRNETQVVFRFHETILRRWLDPKGRGGHVWVFRGEMRYLDDVGWWFEETFHFVLYQLSCSKNQRTYLCFCSKRILRCPTSSQIVRSPSRWFKPWPFYPLVEGHDSPLISGHVNSPSQKGHKLAELPGCCLLRCSLDSFPCERVKLQFVGGVVQKKQGLGAHSSRSGSFWDGEVMKSAGG